jgi:hypothetical protein
MNGMPAELSNQQATDRQNRTSDVNQFMDFMTWLKSQGAGA